MALGLELYLNDSSFLSDCFFYDVSFVYGLILHGCFVCHVLFELLVPVLLLSIVNCPVHQRRSKKNEMPRLSFTRAQGEKCAVEFHNVA